MLNATAPSKKIPTDFGVKNTSPWVLAPTVKPKSIVAVSIIAVRAVWASRSVAPHSFKKFPKKNIPRSGMEAGARKQQSKTPTAGKITRSLLDTSRSSVILISLSSRVVKSLMIGGWITGIRAIYEYAAMAIGPIK